MLDRLFIIFIILFARYIIIAGVFFMVFYIIRKNKIANLKIQRAFPKNRDYQREIFYSTISTLIFSLVGIAVFHPDLLRPYTFIYSNINDWGYGYFVFSLVLILFVHDTYFYWTHRLMHSKWGMKYVHLVHHKSTNPSPWAAFSFHPLESIVEAGIIFVIVFLFPVHQIAVILFMVFMTLYNVYGHLGWELYPKNFNRTIVGKWINTSVNHNQHHKKFEGNYGLYFLFWDRLMGTIRPDYDLAYDEATNNE